MTSQLKLYRFNFNSNLKNLLEAFILITKEQGHHYSLLEEHTEPQPSWIFLKKKQTKKNTIETIIIYC